MQLTGFDHIQLAMPASGEAAAREFYTGILGLWELPKPPQLAARGGCWFGGQGINLHLGVEEQFVAAKKAHPAFLVEDVAEAERHLRAAGVATTPDETVPGVRRFYAADPFGNRLEFIQHGNGFSQNRAEG